MESLSSTSFSMYIGRAVPSIGQIKRFLFAIKSSSCACCPGGTCEPWALRRVEERAGAMGLGLEKRLSEFEVVGVLLRALFKRSLNFTPIRSDHSNKTDNSL